jgi:hypothetical protein
MPQEIPQHLTITHVITIDIIIAMLLVIDLDYEGQNLVVNLVCHSC